MDTQGRWQSSAPACPHTSILLHPPNQAVGEEELSMEGHQPGPKHQVPPLRDMSTWLFMSPKNLNAKGDTTGIEAKGCFQTVPRGCDKLW